MNLTLRPSRIHNIGWIILTIAWFISLEVFGAGKEAGTAFPILFSLWFGTQAVWGFFALLTSLDLDQEGFTVSAFFRRRRYRWTEVKAFVVGRAGLSSGRVVFNFSNVDRDKPGCGRLWKRFINDHDAVLHSHFGLSAAELAETMNHWRWRSILTASPAARAVSVN